MAKFDLNVTACYQITFTFKCAQPIPIVTFIQFYKYKYEKKYSIICLERLFLIENQPIRCMANIFFSRPLLVQTNTYMRLLINAVDVQDKKRLQVLS